MNRFWNPLSPSFLLFAVLMGCGGSKSTSSGGVDPTPASSSNARRTTLIYMVGSTLTAAGDANLKELINSKTDNPNVSIVVETGGKSDADGWETTRRRLVRGNDLQLLADLGVQNMGKGSTLEAFIEWGVKTYPADKYDLVLWDHGGGSIGGFGPDESTATPTTMSVPELAGSLAAAESKTGVLFETLGFDACLMASLEVAAQLQPFAKYYLASEDIEPGAGWDYTAFRDTLNAAPDASGADFGTSVVKAFMAKMQLAGSDAGATLAVVDMSHIPTVVRTVSALATAFNTRLSEQGTEGWTDIAVARQLSDSYLTTPLPFGQYFGEALDLVDAGDFAAQPSLAMADTTKAVTDALGAAVVFHDEGVVHKGRASGLTLYVPRATAVAGSDTLSKYLSQAAIAPYSAFLKNYVAVAGTQQVSNIPAPTIASDGVMSSPVPPTIANYFVALGDGNGNVYALQAAYGNRDGMTLFPDSKWPMLGSQYLLTVSISGSQSESSQLLAAPILIGQEDQDPSPALLILENDWLRGTYKVLGYQGVDGVAGQELASRTFSPDPGDVIYPLSFNPAKKRWVRPSEGITVPPSGLNVTVGALPTNPFSVQFGAVPLAGAWSFGASTMHP